MSREMYDPDVDVRDFESREAGDKNVYVRFYMRPKLNESKSDKEGRLVYDETEYVEIRTPGNATNVIQRPVTEIDTKRFRRQYRAFKEDKEQQMPGTPLEEVPWITRSQVEELKYLKIMTLEQLSEVNDDVCSRMPGMFKLKQRAQKFVAAAENAAPILALQAQLEELQNKLEAQSKTIDDQSALIRTLNERK